ncbi:helix-turn-helix domain-containing protein [Bacillus cereus]|uniref:helix-turn-helix domain-containing protein n=1 Tax=Bacillus cereus group TaxID=86661 RepID=UPI001D0EEA37|nr:helix-turn-helix transcriptional regulator [Bacillus cereus]MCC2370474.1 helix-turn-helix domain-containing protein [Bacillus cereus]MCC2453053.1 helix-turn-helix domain-containing protein [Bacillus cereus]MCU5629475.1 helix-turn-helix domain-containing protein [Bacillus cereus]
MSNVEGLRVLVDVDKLPIHQKIRVKRVAEGITQPQLCELLGLPNAPFLSRIETGEKPIPAKFMERILDYLYEEEYEDGQLRTMAD